MTLRTLRCHCQRKAGVPACPLRNAKKDVNDYSWKYTEDVFQTPISEGVIWQAMLLNTLSSSSLLTTKAKLPLPWRRVKSHRTRDKRMRVSVFPGPYLICRSLQWVERTEYSKYSQHIPTTSEEKILQLKVGFCTHRFAWVLHKQTPLRTLLWTSSASFQYLWFIMDERFFSLQDNDFSTFSSSHFDQHWVLYLWCLHEK